MTAVDVTDRAAMAAAYLDAIYGGQEGWLFVGHGYDPYLEGGKVKHRRFEETTYAWPRQRDELISHVVDVSAACDVWVTPGLSENPIRRMDRANRCRRIPVGGPRRPRPRPSADAPGSWSPPGDFAVASGRGAGHRHIYVALDDLTDPHTVRRTQPASRRLGAREMPARQL